MVKICAELPRTKTGKIKIENFMKMPILSEEAFKVEIFGFFFVFWGGGPGKVNRN